MPTTVQPTIGRLGNDELLYADLQALYRGAGYRRYRQQNFEEYALYLENRNFLGSEHAITFHDLSGRLLALKPDVTLSIVKHSRATRTAGEKLFYREKVYRLQPRSREFAEIDQIGLEVLGNVDAVQTLEVCALALDTLSAMGDDIALDFSHMAYLTGLFDSIALREGDRKAVVDCIRSRNVHDLRTVALQAGLGEAAVEKLVGITALPADFPQALALLRREALTPEMRQAADELAGLYEGLCALGYAEKIHLDFSISSDIGYYNGILFRGYLLGAHKAVLSGGRYDNLAKRLGHDIEAMGFAVYLSDLPRVDDADRNDADVLLRYRDAADACRVLQQAAALRREGLRVRVEPADAAGLQVQREMEV